MSVSANAQDIPEDELQARINTYFDNFGVTVIYPSINYSKKLSENTSVSATYLTDIISAASMQSLFEVDGVTSATDRTYGGSDDTPDEWRHELGLGVTQKFFDGSFYVNGIYSIEHDYSSKTLLGSVTYPFAQQNAYLTLGATISFDKIFPENRYWTKDRNTYAFNAAFSQILGKNVIAQIDASYIDVSGYQLVGYQIVRIYDPAKNNFTTYEPVYPDTRIRRALGVRANIGITDDITLQPGYRYYWDSWDINSNTMYAILSRNFSETFSASLEYRQYYQTQAFFFLPYYTSLQEYMGVDGQINSGYSNVINFNFTLTGKKGSAFLTNENLQLIGTLGYYKRHYDSPDWHSGLLNLYALLFNIGIRYYL
ncbi:MAG TPA: DUF3570 domain-containing protein [Ignavibacteria bacterium]|nr:DUF3570 domain-containing protein [Ignavibacteria bacterium]HMR41400.1 DUF3570 domain-containing protein [Ignavibacteria bacterium]